MLRQMPALILPSGELMTESAAILIWLADAYPAARPLAAVRQPRGVPAFLRWMQAFVGAAAIYAPLLGSGRPFAAGDGQGAGGGDQDPHGRAHRPLLVGHGSADGPGTVSAGRRSDRARRLCDGGVPLDAAPQGLARAHRACGSAKSCAGWRPTRAWSPCGRRVFRYGRDDGIPSDRASKGASMLIQGRPARTAIWPAADRAVEIIDQTRLPHAVEIVAVLQHPRRRHVGAP